MNALPKLLLAAALVLVALGVGVAVLQPGSLGDEEAGTEAAPQDVTETETETAGRDGDTGTDGDTQTDGTVAEGTTTVPTTTAAPPTPSPTQAPTPPGGDGGGTGLAGGGQDVAADTADGLADTGGTSAAGVAVALAIAGLALRRRTA